MFDKLKEKLVNATPVKTAEAHCDAPCGVYDPAQARVEAESVYMLTKKILDLKMPEGGDAKAHAAYHNTLTRFIAIKVIGSVPGARPSPRSMRPGYSDSSVPNCSAMSSGEWFGSMIPPAPRRIFDVPCARNPSTTDTAALAMPTMLWCSATQYRS